MCMALSYQRAEKGGKGGGGDEADGYNLSECLQEEEAGGTSQLNYNNKLSIDAGPLAKNRSRSSSGLNCVCVKISGYRVNDVHTMEPV